MARNGSSGGGRGQGPVGRARHQFRIRRNCCAFAIKLRAGAASVLRSPRRAGRPAAAVADGWGDADDTVCRSVCAGLAVLLLVAALLLWWQREREQAAACRRRCVRRESTGAARRAAPTRRREDDLPLRGRRSLLPGPREPAAARGRGIGAALPGVACRVLAWAELCRAAVPRHACRPRSRSCWLARSAWCRLWWLAERRTQKIVRQLPRSFDALVRMVTIGSSLPSAFQDAVPQSDPTVARGVGACRATDAGRPGTRLAMRQVARQYRIENCS